MLRSIVSDAVDRFCQENEMKLSLWTYTKSLSSIEMMYEHLFVRGYQIDSLTMDMMPFE